MSRFRTPVTAFALGLIALLLIVSSSWYDSPSWDEPEHIVAGVTYLRYGHFFYNPFHPPLVKDLAGLAVLASEPPSMKSWPEGPAVKLFEELFAQNPQALIRIARMPLQLLSSAFFAIFFLTIKQRWGYRAGLIGSLLLLMNPLILAHSGVVHNDVPAAIFIYLSLWFLSGSLCKPDELKPILGFALVAGTAQLVKFSCLIIYPVYLLAITFSRERRKHWQRVPLSLAIGLAILWVGYITHPCPSDFQTEYRQRAFKDETGPIISAIEWAEQRRWFRRLAWYATGVLAQTRRVSEGHDFPVLLDGELHPEGTSVFFPRLLMVKVPLAIWLALLLAGLGLKRVWDTESRLYALFCALYLGIAINSSLNLGLRHLLPVFPFIFALAGRALSEGLEHFKNRWYRKAVWLSLGMATVTALASWPNYISYFNVLSTKEPPAVDSDYDWGTDLLRLSHRVESEGWRPITVHYFGNLHPRLYLGQDCRRLNPQQLPERGWLAVSATHYFHLMASTKASSYRTWLSHQQKVDQVGTFIVFRVGGTEMDQ